MTTRALTENPSYSISELAELIKSLFQVDRVLFIPEQPSDFTGHSAGMVRFIYKKTVLMNDYSEEPEKGFYNSLKASLHNAGLEAIVLSTKMYKNKTLQDAGGDNINYLQMESHIFLPVFNQKEGEIVIRIFEKEFTEHEIVPVLSSDLAKDGGIINCVTWNIRD